MPNLHLLHPAIRFLVGFLMTFFVLQVERLLVRLFRPIGDLDLFDYCYGYPANVFLGTMVGFELVLLPYFLDVVFHG